MVAYVNRKRAVWTIGILFAFPVPGADAQMTARAYHDAAAATNAACGFRSCPPKVRTYGYYHEHWRRWPEDSTAGLLDELSPFAVPDRSAPNIETPDARDETSQVLRKRTEIPAPAEDAEVPMPGSAPAASTAVPGDSAAGSAIPTGPGVPATGPADTSLPFPSTPGQDAGDSLLPSFPGEQESLPGFPPSGEPSTPSTAPEIDSQLDALDSLDFGQRDADSMPPLSRTMELDRGGRASLPIARASHVVELAADPSGRRGERTTQPTRQDRPATDAAISGGAGLLTAGAAENPPVAEAGQGAGRTNPLRPKVKASYASQRTIAAAAGARRVRPAIAPTKESAHSEGRSNPLRR